MDLKNKMMLQDSITIKKRHQKFIKEIVLNETVWGLKSEKGFATSSSVHFEYEDGAPVEIVCFWSNPKLARVSEKNWKEDYIPEKMSLTSFLENWCIGLHIDNTLIGTNFDWNMFGQENEPTELALEIIKELEKNNKTLIFKKFTSQKDFKSQTIKARDDLRNNA